MPWALGAFTLMNALGAFTLIKEMNKDEDTPDFITRAQYFKSDLTGLSWSDWIKSRSDVKTGYFNTDPDNPDPEDQDSAPVIQSSLESR